MKRRQFLKSVFGVTVGLAVAPSLVKSKKKPDLYPRAKDCNLIARMDAKFRRLKQQYPLGTVKETGFGLSYRKYRYCKFV